MHNLASHTTMFAQPHTWAQGVGYTASQSQKKLITWQESTPTNTTDPHWCSHAPCLPWPVLLYVVPSSQRVHSPSGNAGLTPQIMARATQGFGRLFRVENAQIDSWYERKYRIYVACQSWDFRSADRGTRDRTRRSGEDCPESQETTRTQASYEIQCLDRWQSETAIWVFVVASFAPGKSRCNQLQNRIILQRRSCQTASHCV